MDFDIVKIVTDKFVEIKGILKLADEDVFLVMDVDIDNILIGIQYNETKITEKMRLQIIAKLGPLKRYLICNHIIVNARTVLFQGTSKRGGINGLEM